MSFDLEKLQAVAELGEVIRLQNEALERLTAFRKARPYIMMPNLAKMVEENLKENIMVLYKELNNLHKPAEQQTRYICQQCKMAFLVPLPGGICDQCRARQSGSGPREYVPYQGTDAEDDEQDKATADENAESADVNAETTEEETPAPSGEDTIESAYAALIADSAAPEDEESANDKPAVSEGSAPEKRGASSEKTEETTEEHETAPEIEEPAADKTTGAATDIETEADGDDYYDTPGDKIELANPAPDVAAPEGVEGVPDETVEGADDEQR